MKQTVRDFFRDFPNGQACLDHLFDVRSGKDYVCPACQKPGKWYPLANRRAYSCQWCGHHEYPCVGTPFERSRTNLQLWFYVIFLFTKSRHGVSAKEVERQIGVTYKAAWRMCREIREHMGWVDGDPPLSGHVEADEPYVGGRVQGKGRGLKTENKSIVFGMVQRGGHATTRVIDRVTTHEVTEHIRDHVVEGSKVSTDEAPVYKRLRDFGYNHDSVNHRKEEWVRGDTHTNTIENFWSGLKRSIAGTHIHVSRKYLPVYLGEFEYRYNARKEPEKMLPELLSTFPPLKQE